LLNLRELQLAFQQYILTQDSPIKNHIIETSKVSRDKRLEIYLNAYYLRFIEILSDDYVLLKHVMGEDAYEKLCCAYIDANPSTFRSARWFGKYLPTYLKNSPLYSNQPHLSEIASFEWLLTESFDAADAPTVTVNDMALIPDTAWPTLCFELHPSLRQISLEWNTADLWDAYKMHQEISLQKSNDCIPWILWRKELDIHFRSLTEEENAMLNGMIAGKNFSEICEDLCDYMAVETVAMQAAMILKDFIMDGFTSIKNNTFHIK
jgi:hypothetical protein